ncbi:MAG: Glu-tRNA(Gln) amidotransferase subunit GatE [Candidatus Micrarchaeota archaeon]
MNANGKYKLKCGLEIHQRLDTKKLFCNCYSDQNKLASEKTIKITRKLRPTIGELGKIDVAATFEGSEKTYEYTCGEKSSCLVESDEEPPHTMNEEALQIVLQVAKALNAKIVNEVHVMRKNIIDGSTVSGFQRTALIAVNGKITVDGKRIGIASIGLEEESSRIIERSDTKHAEYALDRLGIPLIEIATDPDIDSPEMAKKVALELGEILRNTGKVQRGLGTIRQDVNISIEGGERIEIKGFQDLAVIEDLIKNEIQRQTALIEIKNQLVQRKAKIEDKMFDVTKVFQNTQSKIILNAVAGGAKVIALKLAGFATLLSMQIQPGFSFGKELEDQARLTGARGIFHSDENLEKWGISEEEKKTTRELLNCNASDAFAICIDNEVTAKKALENVFQRAKKALAGVPRETRKPEDKITRFTRPLAGSARMYPETDALPRHITAIELQTMKDIETPAEKVNRYMATGLNEELSKRMASHPKFQLFEEITRSTKCDVNTAAVTILETITALRREGVAMDNMPDDKIKQTLEEYGEGTIAKPAISLVLKLIANNPEKRVNHLIYENKLQRIEGEALRKIVVEHQGNIAAIMQKFKANIEPSQLNQLLKTLSSRQNGS